MKQYKQQYDVAIIAPNCFYYQVDLYRQLSEHPRINLMVYFCSDEALSNEDAAQMYGYGANWGTGEELLIGYKSKFLRNYSPRPSYLNSVIGLMNWGVWSEIKNNRPDAIIMMSWMNPTWWLSVLAALCFNIPFLLMTDANVYTERNMSRVKKLLRKIILGQVLFRTCSAFLCAGNRNKALYSTYGVPEEKLYPFAYSSGYSNLVEISEELTAKKENIREQLGVKKDQLVFMFCGRLSKEKNVVALLDAFHRLDHPGKVLIIVGDGEEKNVLEEYVSHNHVSDVHFEGFKNRKEVLKYYAGADVLVLPSSRETWGMVVNEGMCFRLPIILSDAVGSIDDMLIEGHNGFGYLSDDNDGLFNCLKRIAGLNQDNMLDMGEKSFSIIREWAKRDLGLILSQSLDRSYNSM